jgi:hypothetical protein
MDIEFKTLGEFIAWLATGPGVIVAMSFIQSYMLERFPFWLKLDSTLKAGIVIVLAGLFSYAMSFLSGLTALVNDPQLNVVFVALVFYVGSQVAYRKYFRKEGTL